MNPINLQSTLPASPSKKGRCHLCEYRTVHATNLRRHLSTIHQNPGGWTTTCCHQTFLDKASYRVHKRTIHQHTHECVTCPRIFKSRPLLLRHQSVHNEAKQFTCHLCTQSPYTTSRTSNLRRHLKIHDRSTKLRTTNSSGITESAEREVSHSNSGEGFGSNENRRLVNCAKKPGNQDEAYWERKRKNIEAKKRSRDARRAKHTEIAIRAAFLEQENLKLRFEVEIMKKEIELLKMF